MIIFLTILQGLYLGLMGFCVYMLYRNTQVYRLREKMLNAMQKYSSESDPGWRIKAYESVSYNDMMHQFWKPLKPESFYDDVSFLQPK